MPWPKGFRGGATACGLKPSGKSDLGVILSDRPCSAAGLFTKSLFAGANIPVCQRNLRGAVRGLVVHAGQANACTGTTGTEAALETLRLAGELFGVKAGELVLGSTGVIGVVPNVKKISEGLGTVHHSGLSPDGIDAVGRAMMTTDHAQKTATATVTLGGKRCTIVGIAKGSGMIHPSMGTMLSYVMTDAAIDKAALKAALSRAADRSFHCLTVDGDTSTSDMLIAFANGAAGGEKVTAKHKDFAAFEKKLTEVCASLARQIAADGEGATKLVTLNVRGARNEKDARRAAMAVGTSNLTKCAIFGSDPNWGRIAAALGRSGARFNPLDVAIKLQGEQVFRNGQPIAHEKAKVSKKLKDAKEVTIDIVLGSGPGEITAWTCDLTYDYVKINAEYTT